MLSEKQVQEIRTHLDQSQNPLFFFDNDNDGLCSFLQLQRFIGRGKGIAIKSFPDLNMNYYHKVKELKPDYVFILDKPLVSNEFLTQLKEDNIPIVWIDHHFIEEFNINDLDPWINYYNPYYNDKTSEPVSYLTYKITNKKEDMWISMIGCISDCYLPDFYEEFKKTYPDLTIKKSSPLPFDLLYSSEIGKIARILDFSLKDTITNVVAMLKFMMKITSPTQILSENNDTKQILKRFKEINTKYQSLIEVARIQKEQKLLLFQYGGKLSLSANLSNQLSYEFPDHYIIVIYLKGDVANISLRGKDVKDITLKAIEKIPQATGGGHKDATGAKMNVEHLPKFKEEIKRLIK